MQKGETMRSFIAVDLNPDLVQPIMDIQSQITEGKIKFVEPENLHFTLKFLGEITEKKAHDVIAKLNEVCAQFEPFSITLKGIGVFPSIKYMKVVWIGVDSEKFFTLSTLVDSSMSKLGFKQERNIIPHLTVGRVKAPGNKAHLQEQIQSLKTVTIGDMVVDKVVLKKSELTRKGPIYTDIEEIAL
jgi:2'-5' RNA ligase